MDARGGRSGGCRLDGFRFGGWEWYYQAGRDRAFDRLSVGTVLLAHTIRAAMEDGARGYSFLRGGEEYKFRFTDDERPLETIGVSRGMRGGAALGSLRLVRELKGRRERAAATG